VADRAKTYTQYYLTFFGERRLLVVELVPECDDMADAPHCEISTHGLTPPENEKDAEDIYKYQHPCWCKPVLIYADDEKGNEVWLHNWVQ